MVENRSNRPRHRFKLQSKDIKQQGRTRPTGSMLRSHSFLHASRQSTVWSKTAGFHISARTSRPNRGENAGHPCRWAPSVRIRRTAWSGRIGSWLEHAMSLRRAGTFSPVHAVFSHTPGTCSMAFLTAYRQSHHNTAGTRRKPFWKASGRLFEGYIPSLSENRRERHSRQPLERHRPKHSQPYS